MCSWKDTFNKRAASSKPLKFWLGLLTLALLFHLSILCLFSCVSSILPLGRRHWPACCRLRCLRFRRARGMKRGRPRLAPLRGMNGDHWSSLPFTIWGKKISFCRDLLTVPCCDKKIHQWSSYIKKNKKKKLVGLKLIGQDFVNDEIMKRITGNDLLIMNWFIMNRNYKLYGSTIKLNRHRYPHLYQSWLETWYIMNMSSSRLKSLINTTKGGKR